VFDDSRLRQRRIITLSRIRAVSATIEEASGDFR
jgi:hypothetical protein